MLRSASVPFEVLVVSANHHVTIETSRLVHVATDRRYPTYMQPVLVLPEKKMTADVKLGHRLSKSK